MTSSNAKRIPTHTIPHIVSAGPIDRFATAEAIWSPSVRALVEGKEAEESTDDLDVWAVASL